MDSANGRVDASDGNDDLFGDFLGRFRGSVCVEVALKDHRLGSGHNSVIVLLWLLVVALAGVWVSVLGLVSAILKDGGK